MRIILIQWLLVFAVSSGVARGSAVIICRSDKSIIVVADSKTLNGAGEIGKIDKIDKIRIFEEENIGYAAAGIVKYDISGYDLHKIAEDACKHHGDINEKTNYFIKNIEPKFIEALNAFSSSHQVDIRDFTMQTAFFNVTENIPIVTVIKIIPDLSYKETKNYELRIKKAAPEPVNSLQVYYLGRYVEMYKFLYGESLIIDPVKEMKRLMNIAIESHHDVGPPIDVLLVDKKGFHWLENDDVFKSDFE